MSRRPRSPWAGLVLRALVAVGLVALVFRIALPGDADPLTSLARAWVAPQPVAFAWLAVACAVLGVSVLVGAARFRMLTREAGLDVGFGAIVRAYLVAAFFNIVLPGAILGDVYRVWDARRDTGRGSEVLGLIVLERLLGLAALGAIALAALPAVPLGEDQGGLALALAALCAAFLIGTAAVLYPPTNRLLRRTLAPLRRLSQGLADRLDRALAAVASVSGRPRVLLYTFALSVLAQALPVAAVFALSMPLDTQVAWYWYAVIVPFVTLVALVPISLGGAGVRESLYVTFFGAVGMPAAVALALSLQAFAISLVWGVVGLAVFALGRRRAAIAHEGSAL